jgi:hypothetical protein
MVEIIQEIKKESLLEFLERRLPIRGYYIHNHNYIVPANNFHANLAIVYDIPFAPDIEICSGFEGMIKVLQPLCEEYEKFSGEKVIIAKPVVKERINVSTK